MKTFNLEAEKIKELYSKKMSTRQIAEYYQCSISLIHQFCKRNNIDTKLNYIGHKFNFFEIIGYVGSKGPSGKQRIFWKCECKCGNIRELCNSQIKIERIKSCGCIFNDYEYKRLNVNWNGFKGIHGKFWNTIKHNAKKRNWTLEITMEDGWNLFVKQDGKCALTGLPLSFAETVRKPGNASLDRIDCNKGYTIDNVQWVHKDINRIKNNFQEDVLLEYCKLMLEYKKHKNEIKS